MLLNGLWLDLHAVVVMVLFQVLKVMVELLDIKLMEVSHEKDEGT